MGKQVFHWSVRESSSYLRARDILRGYEMANYLPKACQVRRPGCFDGDRWRLGDIRRAPNGNALTHPGVLPDT